MNAMTHPTRCFLASEIVAAISSAAAFAGPETLENPQLRVTVDPQAGTRLYQLDDKGEPPTSSCHLCVRGASYA